MRWSARAEEMRERFATAGSQSAMERAHPRKPLRPKEGLLLVAVVVAVARSSRGLGIEVELLREHVVEHVVDGAA